MTGICYPRTGTNKNKYIVDTNELAVWCHMGPSRRKPPAKTRLKKHKHSPEGGLTDVDNNSHPNKQKQALTPRFQLLPAFGGTWWRKTWHPGNIWQTNFKVGLSVPRIQEILMMSRSKARILNNTSTHAAWLCEPCGGCD